MSLNPSVNEVVATALFALAILHTFSVTYFHALAARYPAGSIGENLFHLLGEVEIAFGLWASVLLVYLALLVDWRTSIDYLESRNFTEPAFVFVIMVMAATRPVIQLARAAIAFAARALPGSRHVAFYISALIFGPLLGSFITEPAAMTVTALLLKARFFDHGLSRRAQYLTLGVLFVNISIGGVLTHFAAPPVLMVADIWQWNTAFMATTFGWKAALAVAINTLLATAVLYKELRKGDEPAIATATADRVPAWLIVLHVLFLVLTVVTAHHSVVFIGLFLLFLGVSAITEEYQEPLKLRESLLVAYFLGGLVVLGGMQAWWLAPIVTGLQDVSLFIGAAALTAITDNAALTYLGAQVPDIGASAKYALVAGAVAGGGLTVIANAPNPAGFAILRPSFGDKGISALGLFAAAAIPTLVAMACLWFL